MFLRVCGGRGEMKGRGAPTYACLYVWKGAGGGGVRDGGKWGHLASILMFVIEGLIDCKYTK